MATSLSHLDLPLARMIRTTPRYIKRLSELGIRTVHDCLRYLPRGYTDVRTIRPIATVTSGLCTVKGKLKSVQTIRTWHGKTLTKAIVSDDTGSCEVAWFNSPCLPDRLPKTDVVISGKVAFIKRKFVFQNPAWEPAFGPRVHTGRIVPLYPEPRGVTSHWFREKMRAILPYAHELPDILPKEIVRRQKLLLLSDAVRNLHAPRSKDALARAKERMAFEEIFLLQLRCEKRRQHFQRVPSEWGRNIVSDQPFLQQFLRSLPFSLTRAQKRCLQEIVQDLARPYPMMRLLEGDVGSGKTVIAAAAVLSMVRAGFQVAIMAPTEILANQHMKTLRSLLEPFAVFPKVLIGSLPQKEKAVVKKGLCDGSISCVIGTHALIQEDVKFKKLGFAVIDEQHRFGVAQRDQLRAHGTPHLLSLSATPIPRTLAYTLYGDLDLSVLNESPPDRKPIFTRIVPEKKRHDGYLWIADRMREGRQVFVVCPLIDESDTLGVKSVQKEHEILSRDVFPDFSVGYIHGRMSQEEKDAVMDAFRNRKLHVLVATTVIEVGIDVPNASIMLIEGAERFGLAQLHQIRGRVGRGSEQSYCFLFTKEPSELGMKRLQAMVKSHNGFSLAELDLKFRGPGELTGLKQSGLPEFRYFSLRDVTLISRAREEAKRILSEDPHLYKTPTLQRILQEQHDFVGA